MEEKEVHETQPGSPIPPDLEITPTFPTKMHPMPSYKSKRLWVLIVVFLIIFGFVFAGESLTKLSQSLLLTTPTPTPPLDSSANSKRFKQNMARQTPLFWNTSPHVDRKEWNTYIKDSYFFIQYPKEFILIEKASSIQLASKDSETAISINFKKVTNGSSIILANAPAEFSTCPLLHEDPKAYTSIKDVFLDYRNAVMILQPHCPPDNPTLIYGINTSSPDVLYELILHGYNKTENERKLNDIIATFTYLYPPMTSLTCNETDNTFCSYKQSIQNLFSQKNFSALIAEQQLDPVTCKKSDSGYPLPTICDGQLDSVVVYGYRVQRNQSEGGIFSKEALQTKYSSNFSTSTNKPSDSLIYQGYKRKDNKAVIVYTDRIQSNLLAFYLEKKAEGWTIEFIVDGIASADFTTLDDSLLKLN